MFITDDTLVSLLEADLYSSGWDGSLEPYPGQSRTQYAMMSLRKSLVKKYLPGTSPTNPAGDKAAIALFIENNNRCRDFSLDSSPRTEIEEIVLGEFNQTLYDFFYPKPLLVPYTDVPTKSRRSYAIPRDPILSEHSIVQHMDLGPGASVGVKSTNFYTKIANSTMASTSTALSNFYTQMISYNPTWSACELVRANAMGTRIVSGSRLSCVVKKKEISRVICKEPPLNMLFQLGIGGVLEERMLEFFGIDLSQQPTENAALALYGSLTQKVGTIDLRSASDNVSLTLCRRHVPRQQLSWLEMCRSPNTTLPGSNESLELHMMSSMGNGFTFPLQTIIFASLVTAVYRVYGIKPYHSRYHKNHRPEALGTSNYGVFGDDIICLSKTYDLICRMLTLLGFQVNSDKSFNTGLFRESCGHDYYYGYNVRGVSLETISDECDCYSAINRLNRWSAAHCVPLECLIGYLSKRVRKFYVPYDESDDAGLKVPERYALGCYIDKDTKLRCYRAFQQVTKRIKLPVYSKKVAKEIGWFENPDGLLLTSLAGRYLRGSVGVKSKNRRAKLLRRSSPRWDWIPLAGDESYQYRDNWKVISAINLQLL